MYSQFVHVRGRVEHADTNLNKMVNSFLELSPEYELCNIQYIRQSFDKNVDVTIFFVVYKERTNA